MALLPRPPLRMVGVMIVTLLSSCVSGSTTPDATPAQVTMAEEWVTAAVAGDFAQASALTYGEFGETEALKGLAMTLAAYAGEYGEPIVTVSDDVHPSSSPELGFVCIRLDYGSFAVEGGLALRTWDEEGLRVWEYRRRMEGCSRQGAQVTMTLPPVPTP